MKFLAVFSAVLAVTAAVPWSWTLEELSSAIQNPVTNPEYVPYLEHALNQMMDDIYAGKPMVPVPIIMPTATTWSLHGLTDALDNPSTDPALIPYLEDALNEMMSALHHGQQIETISVVVPIGLEPVQVNGPIVAGPAIVIPTPVIPSPIIPAPVLPTPVLPAPVLPTPEVPSEVPAIPAAPAASSPLVQIIVNINEQQQVTEVGAIPAKPEIAATPVIVVEDAQNLPPPIDVIAVHP